MNYKYIITILIVSFILIGTKNSYAGCCAVTNASPGDAATAVNNLFGEVDAEYNSGNGSTTQAIQQEIWTVHCGQTSACGNNTQEVIAGAFDWLNNELQEYITDEYVMDLITPDLQSMATQLSTVGMAQTGIIGTFFDAKAHIDGQMLLQKLKAQAHHKYQPSRQLCSFATGVKSLAASEYGSKLDQVLLSERSLRRQLGNRFSVGAAGKGVDKGSRFNQYRMKHCDITDNNNRFEEVCLTDDGIAMVNRDNESFNKDIDFTRTFDAKNTLDLNLNNGNLGSDANDIIALSNNLYGHDLFERPSPAYLLNDPNNHNDNHSKYLFSRSIIAKRNVAENSFNAIAALKSEGTAASSQYLKNVIKAMSYDDASSSFMEDDEISKLVGNNLSYHAQMEVLTKKLYQNPNFYVGLIDKPENVKRQQAAMQSYELMQQRDLYDSLLRSEMLLSILLEIELYDSENKIIGRLGELAPDGEGN